MLNMFLALRLLRCRFSMRRDLICLTAEFFEAQTGSLYVLMQTFVELPPCCGPAVRIPLRTWAVGKTARGARQEVTLKEPSSPPRCSRACGDDSFSQWRGCVLPLKCDPTEVVVRLQSKCVFLFSCLCNVDLPSDGLWTLSACVIPVYCLKWNKYIVILENCNNMAAQNAVHQNVCGFFLIIQTFLCEFDTLQQKIVMGERRTFESWIPANIPAFSQSPSNFYTFFYTYSYHKYNLQKYVVLCHHMIWLLCWNSMHAWNPWRVLSREC